jgi:hypothetical protein
MTSSTSRAVATPAIVEGVGARVSAGRPRRMPRAWGKRERREGMEMAERERRRRRFWLGFGDAKETAEKKGGKRSKSKDTGEWGRVLSLLRNCYSREMF